MAGLAYENNGPFTITSGEALVADRFVLLSSSTAKYADGGEEPIGLTKEAVATATPVAIEPMNGTIKKVTGSKAITAGSALYVTTDGCVSDAAVGKQIGIALTAITGAGGKGAAIIWGPRGGNDMFASKYGTIELFDNFLSYNSTLWPETDAGTEHAAAIVDNHVGGVVGMVTGATDNNEGYLYSAANAFKFQTNKRVYFEAKIACTEANTNDASWCAGLCSVKAANTIVDGGLTLVTTFDGAMFQKIKDALTVNFMTSNGAAQETPAAVKTVVSGTFYTFAFLYDYNDGVTASVTPYVDGVAGTAQDITISGLDACLYAVLGIKAGGANAETLLVDYVHVIQER